MFDVAFSELLVIAVVALLVIGPERLPKLARTLGALTGRVQKYVAQVKEEVNREVRFQELQQLQQEIQAKASHVEAAVVSNIDEITNMPQLKVIEPENSSAPLPAILTASNDVKVDDVKSIEKKTKRTASNPKTKSV